MIASVLSFVIALCSPSHRAATVRRDTCADNGGIGTETHADSSSTGVVPAATDFALRAFDTKTDARDAAVKLACELTECSTVIMVPSPFTRVNLTLLCSSMAESSVGIAALVDRSNLPQTHSKGLVVSSC